MGRAVKVGRRVWIVHPARADTAEFLEGVASSVALHTPWVSPPASPDAFASYMERMREPGRAAFLVRATDGLVGVVNVTNIVMGVFCSGYLGFYAFVGHEGRGLMADGLSLVIGHAFEDLGLHRVEANIQPANKRSIALVRRLGFVREGFSERYLRIGGQWRDHERWALIVERFDPREPADRIAPDS